MKLMLMPSSNSRVEIPTLNIVIDLDEVMMVGPFWDQCLYKKMKKDHQQIETL